MGKRVSLNDTEINVIVQCIEEQKTKGLDYINRDIGDAFMDELISKLLKGRTVDGTIIGIYHNQLKKSPTPTTNNNNEKQ